MPCESIAVVSESCGSCSSAAVTIASAVRWSSEHAVCRVDHTSFVPDVLVSKSSVTLDLLTPKFVTPLLELSLCKWCIILKSSFNAFTHDLALVNNLNTGVHQVSDTQRWPIVAAASVGVPVLHHDRCFCPITMSWYIRVESVVALNPALVLLHCQLARSGRVLNRIRFLAHTTTHIAD